MSNLEQYLQNIDQESPLEGLESYGLKFLEDREREYLQLKIDFEQNDYEKIRATAHNWKGFCQPYGFTALGQLAEELESVIKRNELPKIQEILLIIEAYLIKKRSLNY